MNISAKFGPNLLSGFREDENMKFTDADDDDARKVMTKEQIRTDTKNDDFFVLCQICMQLFPLISFKTFLHDVTPTDFV
jgi:hypothetical protein